MTEANETKPKVLPWVAVLAASAALVWWWFHPGVAHQLQSRVPGADRTNQAVGGAGPAIRWNGHLVKSNGTASSLPGSWPCFRGTHLDAISRDTTPLATTWPAEGPKVLWNIEVGEGFAAPAVWKGRVYLMDYDQPGQADAFRCLSLQDGKELWRYTYSVKIKRNHGMSRTIPSIQDRCAVAIGPMCHVICVDPETGELRWKIDLASEYNTEVPDWYAGQCPLVDGHRLILAPGGDCLLMAVDLETGKPVWQTPNPRKWQMTHSSVTPMECEGQKMYVYCASGGVVGVSATDGALLWETPDWKISIANVPSPVAVGGGRVFLCGGYEAGSMMLQLAKTNQQWSVQTLFRLKPTVFGATQQTPILFQDHLFGVRPDGQFVCLDLNGKSVWTSGAANKYGSGPFLLAQGMFYVLNDSGGLSLVEASVSGFKKLAQARVLEGPDAWGPLALAGSRLLVRDLYRLACLEVGKP